MDTYRTRTRRVLKHRVVKITYVLSLIFVAFLLTAPGSLIHLGLPAWFAVFAPIPQMTMTDAIVLDNGNAGEANPGDVVRYTVDITNTGPDNALGVDFASTIDANTSLVPGSVKVTPIGLNDSYVASGNIAIAVAAPGVMSNDGGAGLSVSEVNGSAANVGVAVSTTNSGSVSLHATGEFTYEPPAGFEGSDSFTYTVENADGSNQATVFITVSDIVWFVDNTAGGSNLGTWTNPFQSIAAFNTANALTGVQPNPKDGDIIALRSGTGTYSEIDGINLRDSQTLIGESVQLNTVFSASPNSVSSYQTFASGTSSQPMIIATGGHGVDLATQNTIRGLTIGNTSGIGINGSSFGTLTMSTVAVSGTGRAVYLDGGILSVTLQSLATTNASGDGIEISNTSGSFSVSGLTDISGVTGTGVDLANNASGTFSFSGGLNITTASSPGLYASASGTINVSGGTISTPSNKGVDINNTLLSITLTSVSSAGGSVPGIDLNATTGSFTVTGDGSNTSLGGNASGGTISNKTGADGSTNSEGPSNGIGLGVWLVNAQNVTLRRMQLNDFSNFAVHGQNVSGFNLEYTTISGTNGSNAGEDEGSVRFVGLTGTANITSSNISGGWEDNVRIDNNSGTLASLTVGNTTVGLNHITNGNDGLLVETGGSASANITVSGSTFTGSRGDLIQMNVLDLSVMNVEITGNTFSNTHPNSLGGGLTLSGGGVSSNITSTYAVNNNTFEGAVGNALTLSKGTGAGTVNGQVLENIFGNISFSGTPASAQGSAVSVASRGTGTHNVEIRDNTIYGYNFAGIDLSANDGSSSLDATITGNSLSNPLSFTLAGIYLDVGATSTDVNSVCTDIGGSSGLENELVGSGAGDFPIADVVLDQSKATDIQLPGYTGGATDAGAVATYIQGRNTGSPSVAASTEVPPGSGFTGGGSCTLPSLPPAALANITDGLDAPLASNTGSTGDVPALASSGSTELQLPDKMQTEWVDTSDRSNSTTISGETVNVPIGTLNPGETVTITFDVVIDSPFPAATTEVCNQGLLSGSNVADLLSDDPDVGGAADPTCTPIVDLGLPVELAGFEYIRQGRDILLRWETSSETRNAGFEVQKATRFSDGLSDSEMTPEVLSDWDLLTFVEGAGNSVEPHSYSHLVTDLEPGHHLFRLRQVDFDGSMQISPVLEVDIDLPHELMLSQNYPNPFNPSTQVAFTVPSGGHVMVEVFDMVGHSVRTLFNGAVEPGRLYKATFDASHLATGQYLAVLRFGEQQVARTMTLMR